MSYFTTVVLFVMLSAHNSRSEVRRALCFFFVKCTQCAFTAEWSMVASKHISPNQKPQKALFSY